MNASEVQLTQGVSQVYAPIYHYFIGGWFTHYKKDDNRRLDWIRWSKFLLTKLKFLCIDFCRAGNIHILKIEKSLYLGTNNFFVKVLIIRDGESTL
jgi:hypothetical protein